MTCTACTAAESDPQTGRYNANCDACTVRAVMDDLVQRLHEEALRHDGCGEYHSAIRIREAADEIERLRAQLAEQDRDAERYRWLRARKPGGMYRIAGLVYSDGDAHFDAAIDAVMSK